MSGPWIVAQVALWVVVTLLALVVLGQLRSISTHLFPGGAGPSLPQDFGGLPVGTLVPDFAAVDALGRTPSQADMMKASVLVLIEPGCEPCEDFIGEVQRIGRYVNGVSLFLITDDTREGRKLGLPVGANVLYQKDRSVSRALLNIATPQAFAIAMGRVVDKTIPRDVSDLYRLAALVTQGGDGAIRAAVDTAGQSVERA